MANKRVKVAMTGAAGHIGYATLFRIASGQMFGDDTEIELSLLEIEQALPTLAGIVMELDDCAFPLLKGISYTSDVNAGMSNVNYAVLIGAAPRKAGMERSDLLEINGSIFTAQGKAINKHAASDVKVFVVGNPCNTNCLIAMHNAPDIPKDHFFSMSLLDELRARSQLAKKSGVDVTQVTNVGIWGNHSATQFPDFYHAKINSTLVPKVIDDQAWLQNEFISTVQQRGAAVIKARGASSAASAGNAVINSVYHLTHDTPEGETFSISLCSKGEYGVDEGLIFSYPCITKNGKITVAENIKHNDFAQDKINVSLEELRHEKDIVQKLKLI